MSRRHAQAFDEAITSLVRLYQFRDRDETVAFGLSVSQAWALRSLADSPLAMGELAAALGLSLSATTRVVDPLARRGLVRRSPDPGDRRVRRVALSRRGRALWQRLHGELLAIDREVLADLAPREREIVIAAVRRLAEATLRWREASASAGAEASGPGTGPAGRG